MNKFDFLALCQSGRLVRHANGRDTSYNFALLTLNSFRDIDDNSYSFYYHYRSLLKQPGLSISYSKYNSEKTSTNAIDFSVLETQFQGNKIYCSQEWNRQFDLYGL
jgi:hypothetical protein